MYSVQRKGCPPKDVDQAAAWLALVGRSKNSSWACLPWDKKTIVDTKTVTGNGVDFSVRIAMTKIKLGTVGQRIC
jgi:hypothetical protein